jgi:phosphatidylcholine synthase
MVADTRYAFSRRVAAWSVHFYTALGLPLMYLAAYELIEISTDVDKDPRMFFLWLWSAVVIDSTDGTLARAIGVKSVLPKFNGRRLDDIVDFLSFVFLPCVAFGLFELFPLNLEWFALVPIMASAYGFCQERAKTEDAFVGFPSYWNVVLFYLYVFRLDPWSNICIVGFLSVMVFVPVHYIYPARTIFFRVFTLAFGGLWACVVVVSSLFPHQAWTIPVVVASLLFPLYYLVLSVVHHTRVRREI